MVPFVILGRCVVVLSSVLPLARPRRGGAQLGWLYLAQRDQASSRLPFRTSFGSTTSILPRISDIFFSDPLRPTDTPDKNCPCRHDPLSSVGQPTGPPIVSCATWRIPPCAFGRQERDDTRGQSIFRPNQNSIQSTQRTTTRRMGSPRWLLLAAETRPLSVIVVVRRRAKGEQKKAASPLPEISLTRRQTL